MKAAAFRLAVALTAVSLLSLPAAEKAQKTHRPSLETLLKSLGYIPIPLTRGKSNKLIVRADIDGRERILEIDTGWSITTLDRPAGKKLPTIESLGAHLVDPVLGPLDKAGLSLVRTLRLGPAQFANEPVHVESLQQHPEFPKSGIIGADFLIRHFCLIDCLDLRLYVRGEKPGEAISESLARSLAQSGYSMALLKRTSGLGLSCEFEINSGRANLLVDTGGAYTVIDDAAGRRCKLVFEGTGQGITGAKRGIRPTPIYATNTKVFKAGGANMPLHNIHLGIADMADWRIGIESKDGERLDGCLGSDLLAANGALIDFVGCKLWFNPDEK